MTELSAAATKFILHWGELGQRWGINRTVAQVHALLYLSKEPLHAEQITALLSVARSNVSTSLRELQAWGIVRVVHVLGDRRDHFESLGDVYEMFNLIIDERKRREFDPTVAVLRDCIAEMDERHKHERQRLSEMLGLFESLLAIYGELRKLPLGVLRQAVRFKGKLRQMIGGAA